MIRLAYCEHPDYVPLLRRAYQLWDELEAATGQRLLHRTGGLYMGPVEGNFVGGALRAAREHGLPHEMLDRAEIARRYPQFGVPEHHVALFEPEAGFLLPERIIAAHAELALRHGAHLHAFEPVQSWERRGGSCSAAGRGASDSVAILVCRSS
jgi:sarcosine oxidase